ncbi:MAG: phospholipid carrier-dependent glycosyltransferase [Candidatus Limnocylindria bacterium]
MTQTELSVREDRRAHLAIAGVITLGVALRLLTLRSPGFPSDVGTFQAWAEHMVQVGPGAFYAPEYFSDYPPGYLYVLWLFGALFDGELLRLAVKAASIPADIAIAVGAAMLAWRHAGRGSAVLAAGLWSLSPGAIFAGPFWGQIDALGSLPLFAALVAAGSTRWGTAGVLAAIAAMVKPQFGIGVVVIGAAVLIEAIRFRRWEPLARFGAASAVTALALGAPFRAGPAELIDLVRKASETYPYTSLFAFNVWSIVGDFWKPDDAFVGYGALLLVAGLLLSCAPLWPRRDTAAFLAAGALAACAFYFLPTRAHERYLFPAFVLLLPLAAVRARLLWPYVALSLGFVLTLYFAFTRYAQNDLKSPEWLEATLFSRNGQIAIALFMLGTAVLVAWRLLRGEARLERPRATARPQTVVPDAPRTAWRLPAALAPGRGPTRRDLSVALLVALTVLLTRGYRLDHPRDMYFDEVYHARTAFELLAQRDPYEWTHPHLAKEIMALGILAFGDDRVVGHEALSRPNVVAFAVGPDGTRASATSDGFITVRARDGPVRDVVKGAVGLRALVLDRDRMLWVTDTELFEHPVREPPTNFQTPRVKIPVSGPVTALVMSAGRVVVATGSGIAIYTAIDAAPVVSQVGAVAVTSNADGSELYVLDARGDVRVVDPATGRETRQLPGGGPGRAIAYAQAPNRLFVARADTPVLDEYELPNGQRQSVPLGNARTGSFSSGATALVLVPRTQFLYALADGRVVVVEVHGASPFASIPVSGSLLGVDNDDDKLLVAGAGGAQLIETGRHALAWRLPGVALGAVLAFFLVLLARRLFASPLVPWLVGAVVLIDGSMFAQARIGMNDIYVTTFIVAAWYFIVAAHKERMADPVARRSAAVDILIAGVLLGLGVASKWAAVYALAGVFVLSVAATAVAYERGKPGTGGPLDLLARRGRNAALLFGAFAVIPLAMYLASYVPWFGGSTAPYGWNLWELTQQMYWYHSSLTSPHCAGSPWWSWPLDLKPVYWYFGASTGGNNGYIYDAGNIVLYWAALPAAALTIALAIRTRSWSLGVVSLAMLAQYVAWIPISRVLFFYHFFTVLPFYLLCLAAMLAVFWERRRKAVLVFLGIAAAVFVIFYPYVSGLPIPGTLGSIYEILPTWHYDPTFYPTESCPTPVSASALTSATVAGAWIIEGAVFIGAVAVAIGLPVARRLLDRLGL